MNNLYDMLFSNISLYFLILIRVSGIFIISPIFARNNLPMILKISISVLIAFVLLPVMSTTTVIQHDSLFEIAIDSIGEFLIGIIIGFICFLYFSTLYLAGTIIDTQIGFSMVNVLDPQTNSQIPIMGNFYNILITLVFLAVNGHHLIIRGLAYSFEIIPIGFAYGISDDFITKLTHIMLEIFILAFRFSAPILIMIFIANVLLGILARSMPQMNVFIIGMPLKVLVGLLTVIIAMQYLVPFSQELFDRMHGGLFDIIQILSRG